MSKYSFDRSNSNTFEAMIKALLQQEFGIEGELIIFGPGKDGAREATWSQPPSHPRYVNPSLSDASRRLYYPWRARFEGSNFSASSSQFFIRPSSFEPGVAEATPTDLIDRQWVFQVKYYDTVSQRSRSTLEALIEDVKAELEKIINKHRVSCHSYVLVTNLALTGVRDRGGRDRISKAVSHYRQHIRDIQIWDAAKVSSMLDAHPAIRETYLDTILPSDVLAALLRSVRRTEEKRGAIVRTYLHKLLKSSGIAKSDEAGDDSDGDLRLEDVYVDLTMTPRTPISDKGRSSFSDTVVQVSDLEDHWNAFDDVDKMPASMAILLASNAVTLLEAGPGYGKSTLCQFAVAYHAARLLGPEAELNVQKLSARMQLLKDLSSKDLDSMCKTRLPFRIELRRYADWLTSQSQSEGIAHYIAGKLIRPETDSNFTREDVYDVIRTTPTLLVLDGFDEVPNPLARTKIIEDMEVFLRRAKTGERADVQVVLSTRPQGYNQEFAHLLPATWAIAPLSDEQFSNYCERWLQKRISDCQERHDALERVRNGMTSPEVKQLAETLLQATVILTIAKNKHDIPHERSGLFKKYVDVIFDREKNKFLLVKTYEKELRYIHQLTAYTLHCEMERGLGGSVGEVEFRKIVLTVWDMFSGDCPLPNGIRPVVDDIIIAAKNRLVFLKGQGPEQAEIGFLISSFREFFAARYLHSNENAVREKVFEALLRREAHWENVLLFYGGLLEPSDQRRWLDYLTDDDVASARKPADALHRAVTFRRMLLKLLPEAKNLSRSTFRLALDEILRVETLWTWTDLNWAADILCRLRSGDNLPFVTELLTKAISSDDQGTIQAAVWLYGSIVSKAKQYGDNFISFLNRVCSYSQHKDVVAAAIFRFGLEIDLGQLPLTSIIRQLTNISASLSAAVAARVPDSAWIDGLLRGKPGNKFIYNIPTYVKALNETRSMSANGLTMEIIPGFRVIVHAFLTKNKMPRWSLQNLSPLTIMPQVNTQEILFTPAGRYINALYKSMCQPTSVSARAAANEAELALPTKPIASYRCNAILGPSTSLFHSDQDWSNFKSLTLARRAATGWARPIRDLRNAAKSSADLFWLLFLVHPRGWTELVEAQLVSAEVIEAAERSGLRKLLDLPRSAVEIIDIVRFRKSVDLRHHGIDVAALLRTAIKIAAIHGGTSLADGRFISTLIGASRFRPLSECEFLEILDKAESINDLPREWAVAVLITGVRTYMSNPGRLLAWWDLLKERPPETWLADHCRGTARKLVTRLLNRESGASATILAAWITSRMRVNIARVRLDAASLFSDALADPHVNLVQFRVLVQALMGTPLIAKEISGWSQQVVLERLTTDLEAYQRVCSRICKDEYSDSTTSDATLLGHLEQLIVATRGRTPELARAALIRLRAISHSRVGIMDDREWKKEF